MSIMRETGPDSPLTFGMILFSIFALASMVFTVGTLALWAWKILAHVFSVVWIALEGF